MGNFRDLVAFKKGFENAMEIYLIAQNFLNGKDTTL